MNIYDIAEEAGVSISTVSRVLNNRTNVKPSTRAKVEQVLEKHNYTPSAIARGLVSKNLNTIGVLMTDVRIPHYATTAYILERELYKIGYNVILCNTGGKAENGADYIRMLMMKGVSGIILIGSVFQHKLIETAIMSSTPTVPFIVQNSQITAGNIYSVMINHESGMKLALDHLKDRGHTKIAYVQDADTFSAKRKATSFSKLYVKAKGTEGEGSLFRTERGIEGGREVIRRILKSKTKFTAVIFGDDLTAIGGVQQMRHMGVSIPKDMAIIGWNNHEGILCDPPLTTIDNQNEMLGIISIKMMENLLEGIEITPTISIDSSLIVREST